LELSRGGPLEAPHSETLRQPDDAIRGGGLFCFLDHSPRTGWEDVQMPNHLTPEELAKETGKDREEVIRICLEEGVPIYHGKIDKTLFQATLEAVGAPTTGARS
jgi:hypothetical protein